MTCDKSKLPYKLCICETETTNCLCAVIEKTHIFMLLMKIETCSDQIINIFKVDGYCKTLIFRDYFILAILTVMANSAKI